MAHWRAAGACDVWGRAFNQIVARAAGSPGPAVQKKVTNPLDKGFRIIRINPKSCFMQPDCEHIRTEVIARRDGVEYLECLDCRQIFEAEDLEQDAVEEEDE